MKTNSEHMKEFEEMVRDILRVAMKDLKPEQIERFNRMYKSIELIPYEKFRWAYGQIMRTVEKNEKDKF